ncbi:MAG: hypothetical protein ACOYJJ_09385 [Anaerovoracaceae bacterium]|jgi:hypothetical protein
MILEHDPEGETLSGRGLRFRLLRRPFSTQTLLLPEREREGGRPGGSGAVQRIYITG